MRPTCKIVYLFKSAKNAVKPVICWNIWVKSDFSFFLFFRKTVTYGAALAVVSYICVRPFHTARTPVPTCRAAPVTTT